MAGAEIPGEPFRGWVLLFQRMRQPRLAQVAALARARAATLHANFATHLRPARLCQTRQRPRLRPVSAFPTNGLRGRKAVRRAARVFRLHEKILRCECVSEARPSQKESRSWWH